MRGADTQTRGPSLNALPCLEEWLWRHAVARTVCSGQDGVQWGPLRWLDL